MKNKYIFLLMALVLISVVSAVSPLISPLSPKSGNFAGTTKNSSYDEFLDAIYNPLMNSTKVININGKNRATVPWFSSSTACAIANLHTDDYASPNMSYYSEVSDEFSQVMILVSMGTNETRMEQFFASLELMNGSSAGVLTTWRLRINGTNILSNIVNDTASDSDGRIATALFNGANNSFFSQANRTKYFNLAKQYVSDIIKYEILYEPHFSSLGQGNITYWLASGRNARDGGMASGDFFYSGYTQDVVNALVQGYVATGNSTYMVIARNITLGYMEASKFNGVTFSVPAGRSSQWTNLTGVPVASCTNTCSPIQWDDADAPRGSGWGITEYMLNSSGNNMSILSGYNSLWRNRYSLIPTSFAYQYYPNGSNASANVTGFYSQGLQAQLNIGSGNTTLINLTLDSGTSHYDTTPKTMDYYPCMGVYQESFIINALGVAIGRNIDSFASSNTDTTPPSISIISPSNTTYSSTSVSLNVVDDGTATFWYYSLNGGSNVSFTPNSTITAISGQNNITVYANDSSNNWNSTSLVYFTVTITSSSSGGGGGSVIVVNTTTSTFVPPKTLNISKYVNEAKGVIYNGNTPSGTLIIIVLGILMIGFLIFNYIWRSTKKHG